MLFVKEPIQPPFAFAFPAVHPVRHVDVAVVTEFDVGPEDRPDELVGVCQLERGSFRFHRETADAAVTSRAAEVAHEEVTLVSIRKSDAWVVGQSGGAVAEIDDRRNDVSGLHGRGFIVGSIRVPHAFAVPRSAIFEVLKVHPPTCVAAFDDIHPPSHVATVGVVLAGKQVAIVIECQLLRIAKSVGEHFEV